MKVKWAQQLNGITLVQVPCWWNASPSSLVKTINFHRPDLVTPNITTEKSNPIPLNPPSGFFEGQEYYVEDVGQVMLASFVDSSSAFAASLSPSNPWWMGEKYDGIRCLWNYRSRQLNTRSGIPLSLSRAVRQHLIPVPIFLDGEVWNGRSLYVETQRILDPSSVFSPFFRIIVFDSPVPSDPKAEFEDRYTSVLQHVEIHHPFTIPTKTIAFRGKCEDKRMLSKYIQKIIDDGGEGVILRRPKSYYEHGRSSSLIKLKSSRSDSEALVVDCDKDNLTLQMPSGDIFQIENKEVDSTFVGKLTKGAIVTLQYENVSRREIPMNPQVVRIRTDLSWEQVVSDFLLFTPQQTSLNYHSKGALGFKMKPMHHWTHSKASNKRTSLENFAKQQGLDPLLPSTWYSFPKQALKNLKGLSSIFSPHGYVQTLKMVFPDLTFHDHLFDLKPKGYWKDLKNRRAYFDEYAKKHGFDPLIPENWYSIGSLNIFKEKQGAPFLIFYKGNVRKALNHVYPDIGLNSTKYRVLPEGHWDNKNNRREFFIEFAKLRNFDPLVASNWYSITTKMLLKQKSHSSVLNWYNGSVIDALLDLFPEIGLQPSLFLFNKRGYWEDERNRKAFFDEFARENNFDPLNHENWYNTFNKVKHKKYFGAVQHYYKGYKHALQEIYPNIGLNFKLNS